MDHTTGNKEKISYHRSVVYGNNEMRIHFNAPPESVKRWIAEKIREQQQGETVRKKAPHVIVVGDTAIHDDYALCNVEFPLLFKTFVEGGFDFANMRVLEPMYLVGEESRVNALAHATKLAFHGPDPKTELKEKLGLHQKFIALLAGDQEHFVLKKKTGTKIPFEDFLKVVPFKDGKAKIPGTRVEIEHTGTDRYRVGTCFEKKSIVLTPEGSIEPIWEIPQLRNIEIPHRFRAYAIGSDSGFGLGPCTCFLLDMGGVFVMWDFPAFSARTLVANGIQPGQIKSIIVSHIHDDHASEIVAFAFNKHSKVELIGSAPILYSLKVKMAALTGLSQYKIEKLFRWREVRMNKPESIYGYDVEFHDAFHPIPSMGAVFFRNGEHCITFSGDSGNKSVLDEAGDAIKPRRKEYILSLTQNDPSVIDAGETIHGRLDDFDGVDRSGVFLSHRSPKDVDPEFNVLRPGELIASEELSGKDLDPVLIQAVLRRMRIYDWTTWSGILYQACKPITRETGHTIIQKGSMKVNHFYIIAHGIVDVVIDGRTVATLSKGEYFGEQALIEENARNASIIARSPVRLLAIPGELFINMLTDDQREAESRKNDYSAIQYLQTIWKRRMIISHVWGIKELPTETKGSIALDIEEEEFESGDEIVTAGSSSKTVYIIARGKAEVVMDKPGVKNIILDRYSLFGEFAALGWDDYRSATVRARGDVLVYKLKGENFKEIYEDTPGFRWALLTLAKQRDKDLDELDKKEQARENPAA